MCGIFGQWNTRSNQLNVDLFNHQRDTLKHRGPDIAQSWFSNDLTTGLAQTRLAIIDLDIRANQPLHNETNTIHVVVNGEIYNYPELRKILEKSGHHFKSNSDSEVVVHGWEEWGEKLPEQLEGMFSFALFDENKKILFAARDRFGIKPFYYQFENNTFTFASELKAIVGNPEFKKEIEQSSVCDFFVYRYIPSPKTIWKNVFKLPPAFSLTLNEKGSLTTNEYWQLRSDNIKIPFKDAVSRTQELLFKSVNKHLLSDVPVGTFLSGGYDSTTLVLLQHQLNYPQRTFSIGFKNWEKSEHQFANIIAKQFHTQHHEEIIDKSGLELLDTLAWNYDEPNGDISNIPTYRVSKLASQQLKVVLSGEGADEIFGGYTWHHQLMGRNNILNKDNLDQHIKGNPMKGVKGYANAMAMGLFNRNKLTEMLTPEYQRGISDNSFWFYQKHFRSDLSPLKAFQYLDIKTFMAELVLQKVDRASMANSLEVRVPFLDRELVEFMFSLHESVYFKKGTQKAILQEILKPHVPPEIISRKKQGFTGPDMFYQDAKWYKKVLESAALVKNGIIQKEFISNALISEDYWRLWKIVIFEKWFKKWNS